MAKRVRMVMSAVALGLVVSACQQEADVEPAKFSSSENESGSDSAREDEAPSGAAAAIENADKAASNASEQEVRTFVSTIYNSFNSAKPMHFVDNAAAIFEPELATGLVILTADEQANANASAYASEEYTVSAALGSDPICGCQDWDNLSHTVDSVSIEGQRAVARLTVTNFGEPSARVLDLVKTPSGWRIFDIDGEFRSLVL